MFIKPTYKDGESSKSEQWFDYAYGVLMGATIHDINIAYDEIEQAASRGEVDKAWRAAIGIASERPDLIIPKRIIDLVNPDYMDKARRIVKNIDQWKFAFACCFNNRTFFHNWRCVADGDRDSNLFDDPSGVFKCPSEIQKLIDELKEYYSDLSK